MKKLKILLVVVMGLGSEAYETQYIKQGSYADGRLLGLDQFTHYMAQTDIQGHEVDILAMSYANYQDLADLKTANYDLSFAIAHSFGGAAFKYHIDLMAARQETPNQKWTHVFFLDPAPNLDRFHEVYSWQLADQFDWARWRLPENGSIENAITWYQHNMQVAGIGVCGVPFHVVPGKFDSVDVSAWGVDHVSMVKDTRITEQIRSMILEHVSDILLAA